MVSLLYKEPVYRILEKIKNEPYFHWPNKMSGNVTRRDQSLYCSYHRDRKHTTEDCRTLKDHLRQLEKAGYLSKFLVQEDLRPHNLKGGATSGTSTPARRLIGVIYTASKQVET